MRVIVMYDFRSLNGEYDEVDLFDDENEDTEKDFDEDDDCFCD